MAISFESLWLLAEEHLSTTAVLHELPPDVLRYLTQALVLAGSAAEDEALRKKYLDQVSSSGVRNWLSCVRDKKLFTHCLMPLFPHVYRGSRDIHVHVLLVVINPAMS